MTAYNLALGLKNRKTDVGPEIPDYLGFKWRTPPLKTAVSRLPSEELDLSATHATPYKS